eukprot:XP_001701583.1 predicted protein [Chlamydomonas reinhardtii]
MSQLEALGRLTGLRQLLLQMDSPSETAPAFVDGRLVSALTQLTALESLHLSTWNLLQLRELGLPRPGRAYSVCWDDLPRGLCSLLLGLRTLGLGGLRCADVPALAPLTRLRHLMLEPAQPPRQPGAEPPSQRDLSLLDALMSLPPGGLAGLRTLWLPNWAMPIKQLLHLQCIPQPLSPTIIATPPLP